MHLVFQAVPKVPFDEEDKALTRQRTEGQDLSGIRCNLLFRLLFLFFGGEGHDGVDII